MIAASLLSRTNSGRFLHVVALGVWLVALPAAGQVAAPAPPAASSRQGAAMLETIRALAAPAMEGRGAGTEGGARARAWIEEQLSPLKLPPLTPQGPARPFTFTTKAGAEVHGTNLVVRCRGRQPSAGTIAVTAHYDHLGVRDGQTYFGADDNASGVAMLLQVARRCAATPYTHTLLLAFLDAEEAGLQGARALVADAAVKVADLRLNVNFDMVSRSDTNEIYVAGPGRWPKLLPLLRGPAAKAPVTVKFGHDTGGGHEDWTPQSDHGVFHERGIPFVYFGVEDHADYHKPTDTPEKIAERFVDGVAQAVFACLDALDRATTFK